MVRPFGINNQQVHPPNIFNQIVRPFAISTQPRPQTFRKTEVFFPPTKENEETAPVQKLPQSPDYENVLCEIGSNYQNEFMFAFEKGERTTFLGKGPHERKYLHKAMALGAINVHYSAEYKHVTQIEIFCRAGWALLKAGNPGRNDHLQRILVND